MTDTNLDFRHFFDNLYFTKKEVAICQASELIESMNLDELTLEKKELKIRKELDLLKKKIDDFPSKEYLNFADNKHQFYNVFSAYLLFHHRDEEAILQESLILNETYKQLSQLLMETQAQLSLFASNVSICCLLLIKYDQGLTGIPEEKIGVNDLPDSSYEQLFDQTFEQSILQSENNMAEFKRKKPHKLWPLQRERATVWLRSNRIG